MDAKYWESHYLKQDTPFAPSLFAKFVLNYFDRSDLSIIELGCGNGRDSVFFAHKGFQVVAIDQCQGEIEFLRRTIKKPDNIEFCCDDFTQLPDNLHYDVVYSRFTLHSVTKEQERNVFDWARKILNQNGLFCIEVRGQKNEIYQLGSPVENEKDAYIYNDHYRRFLHFDTLCHDLKLLGFDIIYADEAKGFAPFEDNNETFIRVIAKLCKS